MGEWISIKDEMPPAYVEVILTDQLVVFAGELKGDGVCKCPDCGQSHVGAHFYFNRGGRCLNKITHWQYMPAVPHFCE